VGSYPVQCIRKVRSPAHSMCLTYTLIYAAAITSLMVNFLGTDLCKAKKRFNMSFDSVGVASRF
jgi:hypothetical protein